MSRTRIFFIISWWCFQVFGAVLLSLAQDKEQSGQDVPISIEKEDSITYRLWTDTTHYYQGDTIHWTFGLINLTDKMFEFISGADHINTFTFFDSIGNSIDGFAYTDCTAYFSISPKDTLVNRWKTSTNLLAPGLYYGTSSPRIFPDLQGKTYPPDTARIRVLNIAQIGGSDKKNLPTSSFLFQNFPNPFNSNTVIAFSLSRASPLSLTIYDLSGRKVITLIQGKKQEGYYQIMWDGRDEKQRLVSSGVYIYRLIAGHFVTSRKMLILR